MDSIIFGLTVVGCCLALITWLRVEQLAQERTLDMRYLEWWIRSIEKRKQDVEKETWSDGIEVDE